MTDPDETLRPAWKRQGRRGAETTPPEPPPAPPAPPAAVPAPAPQPPTAAEQAADDADLERGRTVALIAALGRLQMSMDVMYRQQKKHQEDVEARLARIERAVSDRTRPAGGPPAGPPGAG